MRSTECRSKFERDADQLLYTALSCRGPYYEILSVFMSVTLRPASPEQKLL